MDDVTKGAKMRPAKTVSTTSKPIAKKTNGAKVVGNGARVAMLTNGADAANATKGPKAAKAAKAATAAPLPVPDPDSALREDIRMLGRVLGDTLRAHEGAEMFRTVEEVRQTAVRSEEHTSELQSLRHLVC